MKKIFAAVIAMAFSGITTYSQDSSKVKLYCDKQLSSIGYEMNHPMHTFNAESKDFTSVILADRDKKAIEQVAVSAKISSFDSHNANRDSHAMESTEALKYPNITFSGKPVSDDNGKLSVKGILTFHNVSHPISFDAERKDANGKIEVTGGFTINMTDYGIKPPALMGIPTSPDIKVSFDVFY